MTKRRSSGTVDAPAVDDALTFRAAVRDVKPLRHAPAAKGLAKVRPPPRKRAAAAPAESIDEAMPLLDPQTFANVGEGGIAGQDPLSFQRAGVRTNVMRRLRRGLYPCDGELDLHGLNQSAARDEIANFIAYHRAAGSRCVRIIHGKGYRSGPRGPVLKSAVALWLRRHFDVLAFVSARLIDGGTGAVYVLLRA